MAACSLAAGYGAGFQDVKLLLQSQLSETLFGGGHQKSWPWGVT